MTDRPRFLSELLEFIPGQVSTNTALGKNDFGANRKKSSPVDTATPNTLNRNRSTFLSDRSIILTNEKSSCKGLYLDNLVASGQVLGTCRKSPPTCLNPSCCTFLSDSVGSLPGEHSPNASLTCDYSIANKKISLAIHVSQHILLDKGNSFNKSICSQFFEICQLARQR